MIWVMWLDSEAGRVWTKWLPNTSSNVTFSQWFCISKWQLMNFLFETVGLKYWISSLGMKSYEYVRKTSLCSVFMPIQVIASLRKYKWGRKWKQNSVFCFIAAINWGYHKSCQWLWQREDKSPNLALLAVTDTYINYYQIYIFYADFVITKQSRRIQPSVKSFYSSALLH